MKNKIIDSIGKIDDDMIESVDALRQSKNKRSKTKWIKWVAIAACFCLVAVGSINTLQRFDYLKGDGCSATPGTIVDGSYYYKVDHSGVWKYADGVNEKVLNTYWEDSGWLVNESGLYYSCDKNVYRMDLDTLERNKIFSTSEGTHIGFDLTQDGNVIVTVYDKNARYKYQVLVNGKDGGVIEQLTDKISYDSNTPLFTKLHYQVGERKIELVQAGGDERTPHYMPTENGVSLLPEGRWVSNYGYEHVDGVISFDVYQEGRETQEESEMLIAFADGKTILEPRYNNYSGAIGHILLYVDFNSTENFGSNGNGIWCYDTDSGEKWQLKIDSECEFYSFTNDNQMLYSCVPWSEEQTAWEIIYEGAKPVSLQLIDNNIIE